MLNVLGCVNIVTARFVRTLLDYVNIVTVRLMLTVLQCVNIQLAGAFDGRHFQPSPKNIQSRLT
jgi:hypothetical protein